MSKNKNALDLLYDLQEFISSEEVEDNAEKVVKKKKMAATRFRKNLKEINDRVQELRDISLKVTRSKNN